MLHVMLHYIYLLFYYALFHFNAILFWFYLFIAKRKPAVILKMIKAQLNHAYKLILKFVYLTAAGNEVDERGKTETKE